MRATDKHHTDHVTLTMVVRLKPALVSKPPMSLIWVKGEM